MTATGHGPNSAVMSYTTLGWGSIGGTFIMHFCVAMILLSSEPVIFELPLSYPDLVFTREWGGNHYYRYSWWLCSDGYSCSDGDYTHMLTIGSNGYALNFCRWLGGSHIYFLSSESIHEVLWFIFRTCDPGTYRLCRDNTTEISIMEVVNPWSFALTSYHIYILKEMS